MASSSTPSGQVVHVVVLGDDGVGKTSLAKTVAEGAFPTPDTLQTSEGASTYSTTKSTNISTGNTAHSISITDVSGTDNLEDVLTKASQQTDIAYLCFDMSCPATFNQIETKWLPKVTALRKRKKTTMKILLVGLKEDLSKDASTNSLLTSQGLAPVSFQEATTLAERIEAQSYVPVSALKYFGIQELKERTVFSKMEENSSADVAHTESKTKCSVM